VAEESWPVVRDADELHDALLTLSVLPPVAEWQSHFEKLALTRRATTLCVEERSFWVAAERLDLARIVHPNATLRPVIAAVTSRSGLPDSQEDAAAAVLRGWLESSGPLTVSGLSERLALPSWLVNSGLARLEGEGQLLQGHFTPERNGAEKEWCNRRILARIHRLTLGRLRREIEPVSTADFLRFLGRWQRVGTSSRLHGVDGTLQVIKQLQGYEISAVAWETEVLPRRVTRYSPEYLDRLCLSGEVMWGRLSPHPAFDETPALPAKSTSRRVRPTRVAPLSLFLRDDAAWLLSAREDRQESLSHAAQAVLAALRQHGASFFAELQRATGRLASEVEDGLWELAAAGLVTADGFENLRSLIDTKRRRGEGRGRSARPRHAAGRWALLEATGSRLQATGMTEKFALLLLQRWGVLFRDLLARETLAPPWRDLLVELRRMEARGEIRGGRFVAGPSGEQYALPEAVELMRVIRRGEKSGEITEVSTADPLNLAGIILPGPRLSAMQGGRIRLVDGVPAVAIPA